MKEHTPFEAKAIHPCLQRPIFEYAKKVTLLDNLHSEALIAILTSECLFSLSLLWDGRLDVAMGWFHVVAGYLSLIYHSLSHSFTYDHR